MAPAPLNPAASPVRGPAVTMPARATSGATTPGIAALGVAGCATVAGADRAAPALAVAGPNGR